MKQTYFAKFSNGTSVEMVLDIPDTATDVVICCNWKPRFKPKYAATPEFKKRMSCCLADFAKAAGRGINATITDLYTLIPPGTHAIK